MIALQIQQTLESIDKALARDTLKSDAQTLLPALVKLRRDFAKAKTSSYSAKVLAKLAPVQRKAYEQAFALVYECCSDKAHAKLLVDRMLVHLPRRLKKKKS
jgi:hypothetical protein